MSFGFDNPVGSEGAKLHDCGSCRVDLASAYLINPMTHKFTESSRFDSRIVYTA